MADTNRRRLDTKRLVIGYTMSRLDKRFLDVLGVKTWKAAYHLFSESLNSPTGTFKNLRDEFDPLIGNARAGWHRRPPRRDRLRVLDEMADVSDDALVELSLRILAGDDNSISEVLTVLELPSQTVSNVAERLRT